MTPGLLLLDVVLLIELLPVDKLGISYGNPCGIVRTSGSFSAYKSLSEATTSSLAKS